MLALGAPDTDSLIAQVAAMATSWKPHQVMRFLADPENRDDGSKALRAWIWAPSRMQRARRRC
jgi:hypothetical protein